MIHNTFKLVVMAFLLASSQLVSAQNAEGLKEAQQEAPQATAEVSAETETVAANTAPAPKKQRKTNQVDRLDLDSTSITGNSELPKVLYIVPWQPANPGDLDGRPVNSLLDEVLAPVDRDVFLRQVDYFGQLYGDGQTAIAP